MMVPFHSYSFSFFCCHRFHCCSIVPALPLQVQGLQNNFAAIHATLVHAPSQEPASAQSQPRLLQPKTHAAHDTPSLVGSMAQNASADQQNHAQVPVAAPLP